MPKTAIETNTKTRTSSTQQPRPRTMSPDPEAQHPTAIIQRARAAPESLTRADVLQQAPVQRQEIPEEEELLQGKMNDAIQRQPELEEEELLQGKFIETVQRQEIPEEEELLQGKMIETVQRQPELEEEELLQGKFTDECVQCQVPEDEELMQGKGLTLQAQAQPNRTGMPDHLKSGLENISGMDLSGVRVQYSSSKPAQLNALAYTQGQDIHVAPGQDRHLPHEGWHAVQQMQGRVKPTGEVGGMPLNDSRTLESEADSMGRKALQQYARVEKPKENKSRAVANSVGQKKGNGKQGGRFVDNRPETFAQLKSQVMINKMYPANKTVTQRVSSQVIQGIWLTIDGESKNTNLKDNEDGTFTHSSTGIKYKRKPGDANTVIPVDESSSIDDDRPMDAHSRLVRARDRADSIGLPPLGQRQDAPTPFGMTGLSRNRFSADEPQTTSREKDFSGASNPGAAYSDWTGTVPSWTEFVNSMDQGPSGSPPPSFTPAQNRASAMIFSTTQYSERYRMQAAPKVARSVARALADGNPQDFSHLFPMAQPKGAHAYEPFLEKGEGLTPSQEKILEDMSSSSEDES
jgi:hypothetical protein